MEDAIIIATCKWSICTSWKTPWSCKWSGPASVQVGVGCTNNMQLQPQPPPTKPTQVLLEWLMQQLVQLAYGKWCVNNQYISQWGLRLIHIQWKWSDWVQDGQQKCEQKCTWWGTNLQKCLCSAKTILPTCSWLPSEPSYLLVFNRIQVSTSVVHIQEAQSSVHVQNMCSWSYYAQLKREMVDIILMDFHSLAVSAWHHLWPV